LKAASVGANTVNGPLPCNVVTRLAALNAVTRMVKLALIAVWTISTGCAKLKKYLLNFFVSSHDQFRPC
jgi:hypothetical protein